MGSIKDSWDDFIIPLRQRLRNIGDSIVYGIPDTIADWRDYGKPKSIGCLWTVIKWSFLLLLILGMLRECGLIDTEEEKPVSSGTKAESAVAANPDMHIPQPAGNFGKGEYDPYRIVEPQEKIHLDAPHGSQQLQEENDHSIYTEPITPSGMESDSIQNATAQVAEQLLPFLSSPLCYAETYGIELIRFPKKEKALSDWLKKSNYDQVFLDWDFSWDNLQKNRFKRTEKRSEFVYYGDMKDNRPDGYGVLLREIGEGNRLVVDGNHSYDLSYIGEFKKGKFDGFGLAFASLEGGYDILKEVCPYSEDSAEFRNYYLTWINSVTYMGEFSNGGRSGKGNHFNLIGVVYGSFIEDLDTQHYLINVGEFYNGKLNGYGKCYDAEKLYKEGNFKDGYMHGKGKRYYPGSDQIEYDGEFKNDKRQGTGTSYSQTGEIVYQGEWFDDDYK